MRGEINIRCLFQGDWQVEHHPDAAEYQGLFHLIEQGECWVTLAGKQFHLKKGDLFFSLKIDRTFYIDYFLPNCGKTESFPAVKRPT